MFSPKEYREMLRFVEELHDHVYISRNGKLIQDKVTAIIKLQEAPKTQ